MPPDLLSPFPVGFDLRNAYACALASHIAYQPPELIAGTVIDRWGLPRYRRFDTGLVQGFVAADDRLTLLCFRGTERDFNEWHNNLDTEFTGGPFGGRERVHRGWAGALATALPEIEAKLDSVSRPGSSLFLTGHSLGGALATLAAAQFFHHRRPVHSAYLFGAPRVGCRNFREAYRAHDQGRTFRVVNRHDIVARIPPRLLRYRHVGSLRYLAEDGTLHDDLNFWERLLIYLDPAGRDAKRYIEALADRLPGALDDHRADAYVAKLGALVHPSGPP